MKNNYLVLVLIGIAAMLLGIGITIKITSDPLLIEFVTQQREILASQKRIDVRSAVTDKQIKTLVERFDALEKKIEGGDRPQPQPTRQMPPPEDLTKVYDIPVGGSLVIGPASAPITITGFLDLQCPFSARFQPVIDAVLAAYPKQVKYVVKNFPLSFHQEARPAAKALLAATKQGKGGEMLDAILNNNRDLGADKYVELAKNVKLNVKKFEAAMKDDDQAFEKIINDDLDLGGQVEVRGTPTYYLNGRKTLSRTLEQFKQEIDGILNTK